MKKITLVVLCLTIHLQTAWASFPCCRWVIDPKTGHGELQELCEGVSCAKEKAVDGAFCCSEACENASDYYTCYKNCVGSSGGLGC